MASTLKERSHTWNKSCKDIAEKEGDKLKLAEMAANDEKQEDEEKHSINQLLRQLRKERQEEDHARALLEEMQTNLQGSMSTCGARNVVDHTTSWIRCGK